MQMTSVTADQLQRQKLPPVSSQCQYSQYVLSLRSARSANLQSVSVANCSCIIISIHSDITSGQIEGERGERRYPSAVPLAQKAVTRDSETELH